MTLFEQLGHVQLLAAEGQRIAAGALGARLARILDRAASLLARCRRTARS